MQFLWNCDCICIRVVSVCLSICLFSPFFPMYIHLSLSSSRVFILLGLVFCCCYFHVYVALDSIYRNEISNNNRNNDNNSNHFTIYCHGIDLLFHSISMSIEFSLYFHEWNVWIVYFMLKVCVCVCFFPVIASFSLICPSTCWEQYTLIKPQQIARQNPISEWKIHTKLLLQQQQQRQQYISLCIVASHFCHWLHGVAKAAYDGHYGSIALKYFNRSLNEYVQWLDIATTTYRTFSNNWLLFAAIY